MPRKAPVDTGDISPDLSDIPRRSTRISSQPAKELAVARPKKPKAATAKGAAGTKKRSHVDEGGEEPADPDEGAKAKKAKVESEDVPEVSPINLGDSLPILTLKNEKDEDIEISTLAAERGVVLFLVPKADTPGCTTQACGFRDIYLDFISSNFDVYCLSADAAAAQSKWQTKKSLPYPLLSDRRRVLIKALTGSATTTPRSHFVFEKGGILVNKKMPVKPADSPKLALEFIKGLNQTFQEAAAKET